MQDRFFLQLLGIGGAVTPLPFLVSRPDLTGTANLPEGRHLVIRRGCYTGRLFDGVQRSRGTNSGIASVQGPTIIRDSDLEAIRSALSGQVQDLWDKAWFDPETAKIVTQIREPLSYVGNEFHLVYAHFILQGELKAAHVWSTTGEIPLALDFGAPGSNRLHAYLDHHTLAGLTQDNRDPAEVDPALLALT